MASKDLFWVGSARDDLREFPEDARKIAGHQLHLVQLGLQPDDWKPMPSVGAGVYEIRVRTEVERRVFYIARHAEGSTCSTPSRSGRDRRGSRTSTRAGSAWPNWLGFAAR